MPTEARSVWWERVKIGLRLLDHLRSWAWISHRLRLLHNRRTIWARERLFSTTRKSSLSFQTSKIRSSSGLRELMASAAGLRHHSLLDRMKGQWVASSLRWTLEAVVSVSGLVTLLIDRRIQQTVPRSSVQVSPGHSGLLDTYQREHRSTALERVGMTPRAPRWTTFSTTCTTNGILRAPWPTATGYTSCGG